MYSKIKIINFRKLYKELSDVRLIGLVLFGIISVLVAWSSLKTLQINYELQKKEAVLRQKNANNKLENENLKLKNTYFETDEYLELTARRQFNKAAPGEVLYLIPKETALEHSVKPSKFSVEAHAQTINKSKYQQNFDAWIDFLFKRS